MKKNKPIYTNGPSLPSRIREHQGVQPQRREVLQSFPPLAPAMAAVSPRPWISTGATHATRDHYQSYSNYIELSLIVPYIITIIIGNYYCNYYCMYIYFFLVITIYNNSGTIIITIYIYSNIVPYCTIILD